MNIISGRYLKKPLPNFKEFLDSSINNQNKIISVNCKGKFIWWEIKQRNSKWFLFSTLGMSGTYLKYPTKYSRIEFKYKKDEIRKSIYYSDVRNFGTFKFVNKEIELKRKLQSLGPDMLSDPCNLQDWLLICQKHKNKSFVKFLLEQKAISGVGNIYKSESLYLAKIDPRKKLSEASIKELTDLYNSVIKVLNNAFKKGGSSISDYTDINGVKGSYTETNKENSGNRIMVYKQTTDPFGNLVEKIYLDDNRVTFFVPNLQT